MLRDNYIANKDGSRKSARYRGEAVKSLRAASLAIARRRT